MAIAVLVSAPIPGSRKDVCVLATQVQARTQQLAAGTGQRGQLLVRTHVWNLAAHDPARQLPTRTGSAFDQVE
jgi:hypothetical protein